MKIRRTHNPEPARRDRGVGFSLVGVDHHDALYRAAGAGDDAVPVTPGAECPCCKRTARRVVRVRVHEDAGWVGVCAICAGSMLSMRPGSVIGGLVRPLRRCRRGA